MSLWMCVLGLAFAEPSIEDLLNATDDVQRGHSSVAVVRMHVKTKRYERRVAMTAKTQGTDRTLIVIDEPAKEKGIATLKVGDDIWNYLPRVDRTVKVPKGMMSGSWMGSHFSNDDLVKDNRLADEYTASITSRPAAAGGAYALELVPKPEAPVVWGKVVVTVRDDLIPLSIAYYDEDGELERTLAFDDVRDFDGRTMPARMRVTPADKPDEFTEIVYEDMDFDVQLGDGDFSLQSLRR